MNDWYEAVLAYQDAKLKEKQKRLAQYINERLDSDEWKFVLSGER